MIDPLRGVAGVQHIPDWIVIRVFCGFRRYVPFLKAEIKRADLTYEELAERLKEHGFSENAESIANKLARGTFSATFFLAVAVAIGLRSIPLDSV